jgi:hypothetical protein
MNHYCTYFDRNYLPRALALFESLAQLEDGPYRVFAVCLDEVSRIALGRVLPPGVTAVALHEIEQGDVFLLRARADRSLIEYYWTLTPSIMLNLLARIPAGDPLVYVDADMYFYSPPESVFTYFAGYDALIHEHRFGPDLLSLVATAGRFNVGLVGIRNNPNGQEILGWWRDRCLEWCFNRFEEGKFGDQLYLEQWPDRFRNVCICDHPGVGLAPWNHDQFDLRALNEGLVMVNAMPLVVYHFHSYVCIVPGLHLAAKHAYTMPPNVLKLCHQPYARALDRQHEVLRAIFPEHTYGLDTEFTMTTEHTVVRSGVAIAAGIWRVPVASPPSKLPARPPRPLRMFVGSGRILGLRMIIKGLRALGAADSAGIIEKGELARLMEKYHKTQP